MKEGWQRMIVFLVFFVVLSILWSLEGKTRTGKLLLIGDIGMAVMLVITFLYQLGIIKIGIYYIDAIFLDIAFVIIILIMLSMMDMSTGIFRLWYLILAIILAAGLVILTGAIILGWDIFGKT